MATKVFSRALFDFSFKAVNEIFAIKKFLNPLRNELNLKLMKRIFQRILKIIRNHALEKGQKKMVIERISLKN